VKDGQGLDVANADAGAIEALDFLREEWLALGTRFGRFMAAADQPGTCALLPVMAANIALSSNSRDGHGAAASCLARARTMPNSGAREQAWIQATDAWLAGDRDRSLALHEKLLTQWPRDVLAGRVGQLLADSLGDAEAQLRIAERLVAANPDDVHVSGLRAFALAECNRLDAAEAEARRAIASPWARRALVQCFERRGRPVEGVSFLTSMSDGWDGANWHLALFLIDLDRTDEALAHLDADSANAISLLARLELRGVDVGARWSIVAAPLEQRLHDHFVPLLDLHHLYALARAGKQSAVTELLASLEDRAERAKPFEREAWADCTVPAAHGLAAHTRGEYAEAARLLGQAVPHLHRIGGSSTQRALFGAIHLDALIKAGWNDAAVKILQADERERPGIAATKRALADLYRKLGRAEQAMTADWQAQQLVRQYRSAA
jgi:tetratricopeptide (TPR) repeat protein